MLIPAPARQFRTVSFWLLAFTVLGDAVTPALAGLGVIQMPHTNEILIAHAVMGVLTAMARFFQQQIALTTSQKVDILTSVASTPVRDGHEDVDVTITASNAALPPVQPPAVQVTPDVQVTTADPVPPVGDTPPTAAQVLDSVTVTPAPVDPTAPISDGNRK